VSDRRLIMAVRAEHLNAMAAEGGQFMKPDMIASAAEGLLSDSSDLEIASSFLADQGVWFGPRQWLEEDPNFRQIIPYVLVHRQGKFLMYRRAPSGGEARLHGKLSIGVGGHVDLPDAGFVGDGMIDVYATLAENARREVYEEIGVVTQVGAMEFMGLIVSNDLTGTFHVGVVMVLEGAGEVVSQEDSQVDLQWMSPSDIAGLTDEEREGWTNVLYPYLQDFLDNQRPEETAELVRIPTI
jgi:predicted NUDIX family phosphoesterase